VDTTKYKVTIGGATSEALAKRHAILRVVKGLIEGGVSPEAPATAKPPVSWPAATTAW